VIVRQTVKKNVEWIENEKIQTNQTLCVKKIHFSLQRNFDYFWLILITTKMEENNSDALSIIKATAGRFIAGSRVLLFGSRAGKNFNSVSDFDFLVITSETIDIRKKRMLKAMMRKELARYKIPADILIQSEEEVKVKKEITGHIVKQALKEGVAI
jgi:predicted nucleotidyltransferase